MGLIMLKDEKAFFDVVRAKLFGGTITQSQVDGLKRLLAEADRQKITVKEYVAYPLATSFHETDTKMQPIEEYGGDGYFFRMYDKDGDRPQVAAELGNTEPGDGVKYHGRGDVMTTGRRNYAYWEKRTGLPLIEDPDQALKPDVSARILFEGMMIGSFTGAKMADYYHPDYARFEDWRHVVNGNDRADKIAGHARVFLEGLVAGGWDE